ncbi:MAG TPA: hypothetical protein EYP41_09585 [Anaerolineae bacterium]|nr:hypothetical protein [Anaerolineae bacterium]HIP70601.1 hypothetical protein [Anaerolineae bacterium]
MTMKQKRPYFSHHRLGYRKNPFGALTEEEWTAVSFLPDEAAAALAEGGTHIQLLGRDGCGKTSTLLQMAARLEESGQTAVYEYIPEGQNWFGKGNGRFDVFILDEAQRLNWRQRRRWLKLGQAHRLIFSSHADLTPYFKRRGWPLWSFDVATAVTPATYAAWIDRRLTYFAIPQTPAVTLAPDASQFLYDTFGPNMREAEYFMYEVWQGLTEVGEVTAEYLARRYKN